MQIVKDEEDQVVDATPAFDPTKHYRWNPETQFVLSGSEFAGLLNAFRAILSTEEAQLAILADKASKTLEDQLRSAVEDGRAVEVTPS